MDYEKILKRIVQIINTTENSDIGFTNICTCIGENCPELQESEDERIRKELIDYINRLTVTPNNIDRYNSWVTWLEKQGKEECALKSSKMDEKQEKPKWTEEDDYNVQCCIAKAERDITNGYPGRNKELIEWLKSLKLRVEGNEL